MNLNDAGANAPLVAESKVPASRAENSRMMERDHGRMRRGLFQNLIHEAYRHFDAGNFEAASEAIERVLRLTSEISMRSSIDILDGPAGLATPPECPGQEIRVRTLGGFSVEVRGQVLAFGRKTPKRVLSLLKAIVSAGCREVSVNCLSDMLWPQLDGDRAQGAFNVTLHRLRHCLGVHDALWMRAGCVGLNFDQVWIDTLAVDSAICESKKELPLSKLLILYRGPFLPADTDSGWASSLRIRLTSRFVRAVNEAALRLEMNEDHAGAAFLYERGVERDDLDGLLQDGLRRNLRKIHWR